MTDPSYAAQIVTFTFPHIGNVGANHEDLEADNPWALGCVVREDVTAPSNFRAAQSFDRMDEGERPDRPGRRRHPRADPQDPARGAPNGGDRPSARTASSTSRRCCQGAGLAGARGHGPRQGGVLPADAPLGGRRAGGSARAMASRPEDESAAARRRDRLRLQAQHLPQPRRRRRAGDRAARHRDLRRGDGARARRLLPLERPGRSRRDRRICGAGDPAAAGDRQAAVRHLPRPPVARPRGRRDAPRRCTRAIAAPTTRSSASPTAGSRSPA